MTPEDGLQRSSAASGALGLSSELEPSCQAGIAQREQCPCQPSAGAQVYCLSSTLALWWALQLGRCLLLMPKDSAMVTHPWWMSNSTTPHTEPLTFPAP